MPRFAYEALDSTGKTISGTIDAAHEQQALELISGRGLTPVDLHHGNLKVPWWSRELSLSGASSVKSRDLETFFESFATLLSASLPLSRALAFCENQARNRELQQAISELRADVENGKSLAASLESQGKAIPERLQKIVLLGERSNTLPEAVRRAAQMLKTEAELRGELRSAMVYPIILLVMSLLVLTLLVFYLAPTLTPVFATAGVDAPPVLRILTRIKELLSQNGLVSMAILIGIALLMFLGWGKVLGFLGRALAVIPAVAQYQNNRETLRFCQSLSLMLDAGATLPEALNAADDATTSVAWKNMISEARLKVEAGANLSDSLAEFPNFEPVTLSLLRAGEESGSIGPMLGSAMLTLQNGTKEALQKTLRLLTPALTLFIGAMVGFLIISTITAILDLNDIAL